MLKVINCAKLEHALKSNELLEVDSRSLPMVTLGACRMGLAEKTQALVHQTWLDYGPRLEDVRVANLEVRQCFSDMGTELGLAGAW